MVQAPQFSWRFLLPKYWLLWLGAALLWLVSWLPYSALMAVGAAFGRLLHKVLKSRRKVAQRNIELCFPAMPAAEQAALVKQNFEETGKALFDTVIGWWWPSWRIKKLAHFQGYQHIQAAVAEGKGVLLLAAGWVPPLGGESEQLVHGAAGRLLLKMKREVTSPIYEHPKLPDILK